MSFHPSNSDYVTFVYYCVSIAMSIASFLLTIVIFVIGSFYLKKREEKVQQLKESSNKKDQQRKEWRRFTEKIRRKHRQLKAKSMICMISNFKSACESVQVFRDITGTDVLRCTSELFQNPKLVALCDGLDSVYMLLNKCASLLILDVPKNIKEEIGKVVADLGDLILPFYEEGERDIIEKCLKHFKDCGRPTQVEDRDEGRSDEDVEDSDPEERAEGMRMVGMGDERIRDEGRRGDGRERKTKDEIKQLQRKTKDEIKQLVPYVDFLKLEAHDGCCKFKLHLNTDSTRTGSNLDPNLKDLLKLLEDGNDFSRVNCSQFLKELKKHAGELTRDAHYETKDPDKEEVLHYVRKYLHKIVNERKDGCEENETKNMPVMEATLAASF
ncbi:uncharacterized protein [Montipora capricornis]|uniref:uncharacterized protein n=1 Tax=Montipora capricornis TaxID=246305 RepID=UPI0035F12BA9